MRALACPTILALLPLDAAEELSPWLRLFGRCHVVLVHFPIALLLAAVWFELVSRGRSKPGDTALRCLALGAPLALLAAGAGWTYAGFEHVGRAAQNTLLLHRILGVSVVVLSITTWVAGRFAAATEAGRSLLVYRLGLLATAGALVAGAHLGGTLVYGEGYLTEPLRGRSEEEREAPVATRPPDGGGEAASETAGAPGGDGSGATLAQGAGEGGTTPAGDPSAVPSFERDVLPIFEASCTRCHGPRRQRGKLRLDRLDGVFARDEADRVIRPGDPDGSNLIHRVTLPPDDDDFMPAEGDPLTPEAIEVLRKWIAAGAPH